MYNLRHLGLYKNILKKRIFIRFSVVCETDEDEIVGLNDEGGSEVLGLVDLGRVVGGQP